MTPLSPLASDDETLWRWRNTLSETSPVKYYLFRTLRRRIREVAEADRPMDLLTEADEANSALASSSPEAEYLMRELETLDLACLHRHLLDLPPPPAGSPPTAVFRRVFLGRNRGHYADERAIRAQPRATGRAETATAVWAAFAGVVGAWMNPSCLLRRELRVQRGAPVFFTPSTVPEPRTNPIFS